MAGLDREQVIGAGWCGLLSVVIQEVRDDCLETQILEIRMGLVDLCCQTSS